MLTQLIVNNIQSAVMVFAVVKVTAADQSLSADQLALETTKVVSIFIIDFVMIWFSIYSVYLAGPRTEKVASAPERLLTDALKSKVGDAIVTVTSFAWLACLLAQRASLPIDPALLQSVLAVSQFGMAARVTAHVLLMKQGFMRIIDLDVEERA